MNIQIADIERENSELFLITSTTGGGHRFQFFNDSCEAFPNNNSNPNIWENVTSQFVSIDNKIIGIPSPQKNLFFYDETGTATKNKEITGASSILRPDFFFKSPDNQIILTNFKSGKLYKIDTTGQVTMTKNLTSGDLEFTKRKNGNLFTVRKNNLEYSVTKMSEEGEIVDEVILKDTCRKCSYQDLLFTPTNGIFLLGKVYQNAGAFNDGFDQIYEDSDLLISEFDYSGNLVHSKMLDDEYSSFLTTGYMSDSNELILIGIYNWKRSNINSPHNGYPDGYAIITDTDLGDWDDLVYKKLVNSTTASGPDFSQKIIIFPNPASKIITVKVEKFDGINFRFRIFESIGKIVHSTLIKDELEIDIQHLSAGVYFYESISENNSKRSYGKLIITK